MSERPGIEHLLTERPETSDALRIQILATEHWNLLMTRSMTWNEMFTRAGMYLTVVSAATVALALMAQATDFDDTFRLFALLVLPVVLFIGLVTHIRLGDARGEDVWLVIGMNRLRHGYLEVAPELAPYFISSQYDDMAGVAQTYGFQGPPRPSRILASTPVFVGVINAVVAGVLVGLVVEALGGSLTLSVAIGILAGVVIVVLMAGIVPHRAISKLDREYQPMFPHDSSEP
ncbi:MAG TPA: hypothetical protein VHR64_00405 [Thermomicrobiales bacterium]|nr:hypothetical protein [Thermomicrobiales bacterium]